MNPWIGSWAADFGFAAAGLASGFAAGFAGSLAFSAGFAYGGPPAPFNSAGGSFLPAEGLLSPPVVAFFAY